MRWIKKTAPPRALVEWRQKYQTDPNFGYNLMHLDKAVLAELEAQLLEEQGYLCAYTGRRIGQGSFHLEHLKPQDFCTPEEATDYRNLFACYPEPNRRVGCDYGAVQKGNFPKPGEEALFVAPTDPTCERRFHYTLAGHVRPANEADAAAQRTIEALNLDDPEELVPLRRSAVQAVLFPDKKTPLSRERAQTLLEKYQQSTGKLPQFHFALCDTLRRHIATVSAKQTSRTMRTS